jgi:hypothetical protein
MGYIAGRARGEQAEQASTLYLSEIVLTVLRCCRYFCRARRACHQTFADGRPTCRATSCLVASWQSLSEEFALLFVHFFC